MRCFFSESTTILDTRTVNVGSYLYWRLKWKCIVSRIETYMRSGILSEADIAWLHGAVLFYFQNHVNHQALQRTLLSLRNSRSQHGLDVATISYNRHIAPLQQCFYPANTRYCRPVTTPRKPS